MVLPFARSDWCAESALEGMVAGMVTIQKTRTAVIASKAVASNIRRIRQLPTENSFCADRACASIAREQAYPHDRLALLNRERYCPSALLRPAIGFMTVVAGIAHVGKCNFELLERARLVLVLSYCLCECCDLCLKVGLTFPNLRQGACFLSRRWRLREQGRKLLRGLGPLDKGRVHLGRVKRVFTTNHLAHVLSTFEIALHQRLALGKRV